MGDQGRRDPTASPTTDGQAPGRRAHGPTTFPRDEAREASLRAELEGIQRVNHVVEGVVSSVERATENMEVRRWDRTRAENGGAGRLITE